MLSHASSAWRRGMVCHMVVYTVVLGMDWKG
jgi:hypothetical protein